MYAPGYILSIGVLLMIIKVKSKLSNNQIAGRGVPHKVFPISIFMYFKDYVCFKITLKDSQP